MSDPQNKQALAEIYDALAPAYERVAVPLFRPIAKRLLQLVDLRPGWQVLDAGCGTGLVSLLGAPRVTKVGKIIGVDGSKEMLRIAQHKAEQFGFTQCEFRVGDLEALELHDGQMNAVLSQFALHHTEPARSMHEFCRVLQPGGTLVIGEWADAPNTPNKVIFDILSNYRPSESRGILALARTQSERAYRFRVNTAKAEPMMELAKVAGFVGAQAREEAHRVRVADIDAVLDLAFAAPLLHCEMVALTEDDRAAFLRQARDALCVFQTASGLEWTYNVLTLVAHKAAS